MLIFLDNKQEVIKRISNNKISILVQYKTITSDKKELMNHTLNATIVYNETVERVAKVLNVSKKKVVQWEEKPETCPPSRLEELSWLFHVEEGELAC